MEIYDEAARGVYPSPMTSNPAIWGYDYKTFLFPLFGIYFEKQKRFCIFKVKVADSYHILEPYQSERTDPFYLHKSGNPSDHPLEVYSVKAQFPFSIWFQGAWLCRKNGPHMSPIFPVMRLSNTICKYKKSYSITVYQSPAAMEWVEQYNSIDKSMNRLATRISLPIPFDSSPIPPTPFIHSIPAFVAALLIEDAIKEKKDCSITLEPITKETAIVTTCYHVFDKKAITTWLENKTTCPLCKQVCGL